MKRQEKIEKIATYYGYEGQSRQMIEEMAELTQAINKFWRKQLECGKYSVNDIPLGSPEENNIIEELADVQIMIFQMKYLHSIPDAIFKNEIMRKIDRQIKRIEEV